MSNEPAHFPLLALPDPCLLAVLQYCAVKDQRSLHNAARAHSRLHQAAVAALCSISIAVPRQQQADSVLLYLDRHSSHVSSLKLWGPADDPQTLHQLPSSLQLHTLELVKWELQLAPGTRFQGVLRAAAAGAPLLKQLRLSKCDLLDGVEGLKAALLQLPALEHLSLCNTVDMVSLEWVCFPTGVLQQLPQLTYLQLAGVSVQGPDEASSPLQPLQALTQLADLRLVDAEGVAGILMGDGDDDWATVTASVLSAAGHLTRLELVLAMFEPAALGHMPKLQHLQLIDCGVRWPAGATAGLAALLSQLQHQTQLTHLDLRCTVWAGEERNPPAAAYSALTASSKLQHLNISGCRLPAGVWQHLLPAGRQLPHLTSVDMSQVHVLSEGDALALEGSRIVSCCPNLQSLDMRLLQYDAEQLLSLQGLKGLHTLRVGVGSRELPPGSLPDPSQDILQAVCQLSGLRDLELLVYHHLTPLLLAHLQQLQQLQHLTALTYVNEDLEELLKQEGRDDEPVWRQLLQLYLDNDDPDLAQQAAAALAQ